LPSDE
jgi:hypothetical protein